MLCDVTPFPRKYIIVFDRLPVRSFLSEAAFIGLNVKHTRTWQNGGEIAFFTLPVFPLSGGGCGYT